HALSPWLASFGMGTAAAIRPSGLAAATPDRQWPAPALHRTGYYLAAGDPRPGRPRAGKHQRAPAGGRPLAGDSARPVPAHALQRPAAGPAGAGATENPQPDAGLSRQPAVAHRVCRQRAPGHASEYRPRHAHQPAGRSGTGHHAGRWPGPGRRPASGSPAPATAAPRQQSDTADHQRAGPHRSAGAGRTCRRAGFAALYTRRRYPLRSAGPAGGGGFLRDDEGRILLPRLNSERLASLSRQHGARYHDITVSHRDLNYLLQPWQAGATTDERPLISDHGHWLVLLLLPIAALGARRGWLGVLRCAALLPADAQALQSQALRPRPDQPALATLQNP